jgi:hypothetical protein
VPKTIKKDSEASRTSGRTCSSVEREKTPSKKKIDNRGVSAAPRSVAWGEKT